MLSAIPLAARGPTQLVIFDIHALQERFYFSNQVIPRSAFVVHYNTADVIVTIQDVECHATAAEEAGEASVF